MIPTVISFFMITFPYCDSDITYFDTKFYNVIPGVFNVIVAATGTYKQVSVIEMVTEKRVTTGEMLTMTIAIKKQCVYRNVVFGLLWVGLHGMICSH
jgi:hypothetical protein